MPINYSSTYGGVPDLASGQDLSSSLTNILSNVIPGFKGLTGGATDYISSLLSGKLAPDTIDNVKNQSAAWGLSNGMPGSGISNNLGLKDIGLSTQGAKQQGLGDMVSLLQGYSGAAAPNFGQLQEQQNAKEQYASAPNPAAAMQQMLANFMQQLNMGGSGTQAPTQASRLGLANNGTYFTPAGGSRYTAF